MSKCEKLLEKAYQAPSNFRFDELCKLAKCHGFEFQRQSSSHHIYKHANYNRILTFPECTGKVKPVYVIALRDAIEELGGQEELGG